MRHLQELGRALPVASPCLLPASGALRVVAVVVFASLSLHVVYG